MIREIYTRTFEEDNYDASALEHHNVIESIIQKIKNILCTSKGDVLGDYAFGCNLEDLVFRTARDAQYIESEVAKQLTAYIHTTPNYKLSTKVSFGHHKNGYDFAVIDIYINQQKMGSFLID